MPRRRYQLGPSFFSVVRAPTGWWVNEEWSQDTGQRGRDEFSETFGPFATQSAADAFASDGRADRGSMHQMGKVTPCRAASG